MDTLNTSVSGSKAPINLYDYALGKTRESVAARKLTTVAEETGLNISWLNKFACGKIPGASYKKVDHLARYYQAQDAATDQHSGPVQ